MRQTQGVLWSKGVLLTPQHLQVQDRFLEDTAEFRISSLAAFPWGFTELAIDLEALTEGALVLSRAAGLFRDGLAFDIPGSDPAPPPRPLEGLFTPDQASLTLYLTIPERRSGQRTISLEGDGRDTPFIARAVNRKDENTGLSEKPVMVAEKNFRLATGNEYLEGSMTLPVARVRRAEAGHIELDPDFVPPVLALSASPHLTAIARRLTELLTAKSNSLSKIRRERGKGLASFGVSDVANFWLLYSTNRYLPEIRHALDVGRFHPERLYASMLGLAGALTTFSSSVHPATLPEYDHDDLSTCFGGLDRSLLDLRRARPAHFAAGSYEPIRATGASAGSFCAFARRHGSDTLVVAASLHPARPKRWAETEVAAPSGLALPLRNLLTGKEVAGLSPSDLFRDGPVALLVND